MENKVFLLSKKSKFRSNGDSFLNLNLESKQKVIPHTDLTETLSLYGLYNKEIDSCNNFRLIIDLNPICTNVLFNNVTEIVKDEGSNDCVFLAKNANSVQNSDEILKIKDKKVINQYVNRLLAIKDTEFSHEDIGNYVYHPGKDIFNNHILRAKTFSHIGYAKRGSNNISNFNTMIDVCRDSSGATITTFKFSDSGATYYMSHVYNLDSIETLENTYNLKCIEKDGWFGFENKTNIDIPNATVGGRDIMINKVLNNMAPCSFIDMYPGRDLYSFEPKYNSSRKRIETNWDYCLTYPYASDYEKFNEINNNDYNAVKIIDTKETFSNSGERLIEFKTLFKHTLKRGSYVCLYYTQKNAKDAKLDKALDSVRVTGVGDSEGANSDRIFKVKYDDIKYFFNISNGKLVGKNDKRCNIFYRKHLHGSNCSYYFRKFKKLTNNDGEQFRSEINKLAFAKNIFGDNVSQLIFTDDINVSGLVNNLGAPLTDIYLTILKKSNGHNEWYNVANERNYSLSAETIEYSHAFGKLTSGIELPEDYLDYNIHKIHNLELDKIDGGYSAGTISIFSNFTTKPKVLEGDDDKGITINEYDEFYGDIVELDNTTLTETVIEHVYYRFNTAQRECCSNKEFYDIYETTLEYGDEDTVDDTTPMSKDRRLNVTMKGELYAGNIEPEGYYYNPHYRIQLRQISEEENSVYTNLINYGNEDVTVEDKSIVVEYDNGDEETEKLCLVTIKYPIDYGFKPGDSIIFYDVKEDKTIIGSIRDVEFGNGDTTNDNIKVEVSGEIIDADKISKYYYVISHTNKEFPYYARYSFGRQSMIWREIIKPSAYTNGDDMFGTPYSNGAFYLHKNINFYLKRQDPNGVYFMQNPEDDYRGVNDSPKYLRRLRRRGYGKLMLDALRYLDGLLSNDCM